MNAFELFDIVRPPVYDKYTPSKQELEGIPYYPKTIKELRKEFPQSIELMKLSDLKMKAKRRGIKGVSGLRKAYLIRKLQ